MKWYAAFNALRKFPSFISEQLAERKEEGCYFSQRLGRFFEVSMLSNDMQSMLSNELWVCQICISNDFLHKVSMKSKL